MHLRHVSLLIGSALLAACATTKESDASRLTRLQAFAGAPVNSITYTSAGMGFDVVDDSHLLLTMGPKRSWLLRVDPQCLAWDGGSPVLTLQQGMTGQISVNFDAVRAGSNPGMRCPIREIRPVDLQAAREAERQAAPTG